MPAHSVLRYVDELHRGMRLFHAGERPRAIPVLDKVLATSGVHPAHAMAAASLIAESHRGASEYVRAQQYYELALHEGARLRRSERRGSEWYQHYQPRCLLGLLMIGRRLADADQARVRELSDAIRQSGDELFAPDLDAQLRLVLALCERQRGDLDAARCGLIEAAYDLAEKAPPYTFLAPDHCQALLAQVELLMPDARFSAIARAEALLANVEAGAWSRGVAASVLLHAELQSSVQKLRRQQVRSSADCERALDRLEMLSECADSDGDVFLLTELQVLRAAWFLLMGVAGADGCIELLHARIGDSDRCPMPLRMLRAAEGLCIAGIAAIVGVESRSERDEKIYREVFPDFARALSRHGYVVPNVDVGVRSLREESAWIDGALLPIRQLAWP